MRYLSSPLLGIRFQSHLKTTSKSLSQEVTGVTMDAFISYQINATESPGHLRAGECTSDTSDIAETRESERGREGEE